MENSIENIHAGVRVLKVKSSSDWVTNLGNKPVSSCPQSIASIVPFHIPPQSSFGGKVQLSDTAHRSCSYPTREKKT